MIKRISVAIYSGEIPTTTFIERLIVGVANEGFRVLLFGTIGSKILYQNKSIRIIGNKKGVMGAMQSFARIIWLWCLKQSKFRRLEASLGFGPFSGKNQFVTWSKYAPVVLHWPDIFHVQWAKSAVDWIFLKELFGVKLILSLRGAQINYSPLADPVLAARYRDVFPKYDGFHAISRAILSESLKYGVNKDKAKVIYSGLHLSDCIELRGPITVLRVLVVGRFHWKKGYTYLLDALSIVMARGLQFHLTLIAGGALPEEILFQIHDLNLAGVITWINGLPHDQVLEEMRQNDLLVLPSVEEGIANVVLEAMNMGLPVIATNCGGMHEVITDGVNGYLVPVRDSHALSDALIRFVHQPLEKTETVRQNAYREIADRFDLKNMAKSFGDLYKEVVA